VGRYIVIPHSLRIDILCHCVYTLLMWNTNNSLDEKDITESYVAGESCKSLSLRFDVDRNVINRILKKHNIKIRNRSEGMYTRMGKTTTEERILLTNSAHDAVRGVKRPIQELRERAIQRQSSGIYIGKGEDELYQMLLSRGLKPVRQFAYEQFNIDFSFQPIAVELLFHTASPLTRKLDRNKIEFLTHTGWAVLYIRLRSLSDLSEKHADYVQSYLSEFDIKRTPGEFRVINKNCEIEAEGRFYNRP